MVATGDDPNAPERVRVEHRGDRAVVTLDEAHRLNVLSAPLVRQLRRALVDLDADPDVRSRRRDRRRSRASARAVT